MADGSLREEEHRPSPADKGICLPFRAVGVMVASHSLKIVDDDEWYTVSKAAQLGVDSAADLRGAEVEFDFTTNDKGGKTWYNVKGNVNVTAEAPKTTTAAGTSANTKDVSMTRGGALKVAGDVVMRYYGENTPAELEEIAQDIIKLSRLLEAYVYEG